MSDSENHDGDEVLDLNAGNQPEETAEVDRGDVVTPAGDAPAAAATEEAAGDTVSGDQRVPIARFNEVNEQRKEMQRRWEETQRELETIRQRSGGQGSPAPAIAPATAEFDEEDMERQYYDAVLNDERDKAIAIRRDINAHLQRVAAEQYRVLQATENTMAALDQVTQQALQQFPWLDTPEGDEVLEMIIGLRDRKIQGGVPAHLALSQAVAAIAPRFVPEGHPPAGVLPTSQTPTDTRISRSLARGAADANLQPPAIQAGMGNRSSAARIDVEELTEEQFAKLSEAERSKLRGD